MYNVIDFWFFFFLHTSVIIFYYYIFFVQICHGQILSSSLEHPYLDPELLTCMLMRYKILTLRILGIHLRFT